MTQKIFLSHDVDWQKNIPKEHILKRSNRFEQSVLDKLHLNNPYDNILEYMDIEKSLGVKSTFFFRTKYETGSYLDYEDEIHELIKGGWEVGLHSDYTSVSSHIKLLQEKQDLEILTKKKIIGNRVHYLEFHNDLPRILNSLGFKYDSSLRIPKHEILIQSSLNIDGILELPITWMDAYLFTYMKIKEHNLIDVFRDTLRSSKSMNNSILTLIWHSNVLQMIGGRMYKEILEYLLSEKVIIVKGENLV